MTMEQAFIENQSPFNYVETLTRLTEEFEKNSWSVSHFYDLQETLKSHNKDVLPVSVFSICKPDFSSKVLEKNHKRIISPMMPCRVSVYEKEDGKTYVSRMKTDVFASGFKGVVGSVMLDSAEEVEEMLGTALCLKD